MQLLIQSLLNVCALFMRLILHWYVEKCENEIMADYNAYCWQPMLH